MYVRAYLAIPCVSADDNVKHTKSNIRYDNKINKMKQMWNIYEFMYMSTQNGCSPPTSLIETESVLPSIARQNFDWDTLLAMHLCTDWKASNNCLGSRSQTSSLKKDRDLDHAHAMSRDRTRVGRSTHALSSYFKQNRHDMLTDQMGMVAYLGAGHHMFNKTDTTCQQVNLGMVAYLGAV